MNEYYQVNINGVTDRKFSSFKEAESLARKLMRTTDNEIYISIIEIHEDELVIYKK